MNVLILGGDGYLGWPTAMHMSVCGHEVTVVDNYMKREIRRVLGLETLVERPRLEERADLWKAVSGRTITVRTGDVADHAFLNRVIDETAPDAIIHYAEQPSAPFSMMDRDRAALTLQNNLISTLNLVFAMRDAGRPIHLVKLGTMGEYGTPNIDIEEGYLDVTHNGRRERFLYPKTPGSLYHLSKVNDSDLLYFAVRTWGLAVTDLNQGPVYGISTEETDLDEGLGTLFCYDDIFGTVLNRFVVQAVSGFPLTVYGKGGQVRGYLNIRDTLQCIELAVRQPAESGQFRVLNQFTETFSVAQLADRVATTGWSLGLKVEVNAIQNPRKEMEEHYYNPKNTGLLDLGLKPHFLTEEVIAGMIALVRRNADRIRPDQMLPRVRWTK